MFSIIRFTVFDVVLEIHRRCVALLGSSRTQLYVLIKLYARLQDTLLRPNLSKIHSFPPPRRRSPNHSVGGELASSTTAVGVAFWGTHLSGRTATLLDLPREGVVNGSGVRAAVDWTRPCVTFRF